MRLLLGLLFLLYTLISSYGQTDEALSKKDFNKKFRYEMIFVKGGTYIMGCTPEQEPDCYSYEKPAHKVQIKNFYIGKTEVTQYQWYMVMHTKPWLMPDCDSCPVENVSWNEVQEFIKKLNALTGKKYRLPTEAEWEYAARGGAKSKGFKFSGSNDWHEVAWYYKNSNDLVHPVAGLKPNELGIYDMSGNVWEWCNDWADRLYYSYSPRNNPKGPSQGKEKIMRGGSWYSGYVSLRNSARVWYEPDFKRINVGFRLASNKK